MEEIEKDVNLDSSPEEVIENDSEVEKTLEESLPENDKKFVPYDRFKQVNDELASLKKQPKTPAKESAGVDALDFIKLGKKLQNYSDAEIDFATEVAKSKNPDEIIKALENEYVQLAFEAKRQKDEKDKLTLAPSGKQSESDKPRSLQDKLKGASLSEAEKFLSEKGLYQEPKRKADRAVIGR